MQMRRLPIAIRALDLEEKTKRVASVLCPKRGAMITVGNCGRCEWFRRVDFTERGTPELACVAAPEDDAEPRACDAAKLHELVQVPNLCVAQDTPILEVLPFVGSTSGSDPIPVLDKAGRPLGVVDRTLLRERIACGVALSTPLASLMKTLLARVLPDTPLADVRALQSIGRRDCVVVSEDGTFLGLVPWSGFVV